MVTAIEEGGKRIILGVSTEPRRNRSSLLKTSHCALWTKMFEKGMTLMQIGFLLSHPKPRPYLGKPVMRVEVLGKASKTSIGFVHA